MPFLNDLVRGQRYSLQPVTRIGRDPQCEIRLPDLRVSRMHAELHRLPNGDWSIKDLGSRAGVLVAGERVTEHVLLDGDELQVGETRLRFENPDRRTYTIDAVLRDAQLGSVQWRQSISGAESFPAEENIGSAAELRADYEKLRAVFALTRAMSDAQDVSALLSTIVETILEITGADRGAALLLDEKGEQTLGTARTRGGGRELWALHRGIIQDVVLRREGVVTRDLGGESRFTGGDSAIREGVRAVMCAPMVQRDELVGVIYLDSYAASSIFSEFDLGMLVTLGAQAALAVKNALLRDRLAAIAGEERKRLGRALHGLPDGVVLLDPDGRVELMNPQAELLLPWLSPASLGEVVDKLGGQTVQGLSALAGDPVELEFSGPPRRLLSVSATAIGRSEGSGADTVLVIRDVTQLRERGEMAARADRLALVGQLAGGVAHDFNNLLTVIRHNAELCELAPGSTPFGGELTEIRNATHEAATLTHQLLAFSQRERLPSKVIESRALLQSIHPLVRRTLGEHITVTLELGDDLGRVRGDAASLESVLMNLAVNARDAMQSGGTLTIRARDITLRGSEAERRGLVPGPHLRLEVEDTGEGMTPDVAARVFEPFFTTKPRAKGTGLGLATVYAIVRQMGGNVFVRSIPGRGSTFEVWLPTEIGAAAPEKPPEVVAQAAVPAEGRTVLLVEDEPGVRRVTARLLKTAGFRVLEAADGAEGLRMAREHGDAIGLILSDVVMPQMCGPDMAEALLQERPTMPIVFMSGYTDGALEMGGEAIRKRGVLRKPFSRAELLGSIAAALEA